MVCSSPAYSRNIPARLSAALARAVRSTCPAGFAERSSQACQNRFISSLRPPPFVSLKMVSMRSRVSLRTPASPTSEDCPTIWNSTNRL